MKLLHFADAHIDMANYGRHDPASGLPLRVLDFLKSLDEIIDAAIAEQVDLVLFAGDAYKDRSPAPTFQREWGRRILRLSKAGIPTLLLAGNHDLSPAVGRAHALQEFETLEIPHVRVLAKPTFLSSAELGLPVQVLALPWINRSGLLANQEHGSNDPLEVNSRLEEYIVSLVQLWLQQIDPSLPTILTAHASVQGAQYGSERSVMLGTDLVLPASLLRDPRLDYVALGHIHRAQDLNTAGQPPIVYPGSIERVDFGEAGDDKYYVLADVTRGHTQVQWCKLEGIRPFLDCTLELKSDQGVMQAIQAALPAADRMEGAIVRLTIRYPRAWDDLIDEPALRHQAAAAFEFHLIRRPEIEARIRLPADRTISSLGPLELLEQYWQAAHVQDAESLQQLAKEVIEEGNAG